MNCTVNVVLGWFGGSALYGHIYIYIYITIFSYNSKISQSIESVWFKMRRESSKVLDAAIKINSICKSTLMGRNSVAPWHTRVFYLPGSQPACRGERRGRKEGAPRAQGEGGISGTVAQAPLQSHQPHSK
jgi:hypothetical protein